MYLDLPNCENRVKNVNEPFWYYEMLCPNIRPHIRKHHEWVFWGIEGRLSNSALVKATRHYLGGWRRFRVHQLNDVYQGAIDENQIAPSEARLPHSARLNLASH